MFDTADVLDFSKTIKSRFDSSLKTFQGASEFQELFFGESRLETGLSDKLLEIVKRAESSLSLELGSTGSFVDVWA